jgi:hypothetical protein
MFKKKKLNEVGGKEKYCVEITNRFAALEDLDAMVKLIVLCEVARCLISFYPPPPPEFISVLGHIKSEAGF